MVKSIKKGIASDNLTAIDWLDLHSNLLGGIRSLTNFGDVREAVIRLIPEANPFGVSDSIIDFVIQEIDSCGDDEIKKSVSKLRDLSEYDRRLLIRHICNSLLLETKTCPHGEEILKQ